MERQAKVYTTDRIWTQVAKNLSIGIEIEVIR